MAGITEGLGAGARRVAGASGMRGLRGRAAVGGTVALAELTSPAFAAWLAMQPPGMSRDEAVIEYVRQRATAEPLLIGQWIAGLPGSSTRDQAIDLYLDTFAPLDPGSAAQWLQTLAPLDRTPARLERTAEHWLRRNP